MEKLIIITVVIFFVTASYSIARNIYDTEVHSFLDEPSDVVLKHGVVTNTGIANFKVHEYESKNERTVDYSAVSTGVIEGMHVVILEMTTLDGKGTVQYIVK